MKNIVAERVIHNGMVRVTLRFPYDSELIKITKGLPDPLWSSQMKCWHIQDSTDVIRILLTAFSGKAYIDYSSIRSAGTDKILIKSTGEINRRIGLAGKSADNNWLSLSERSKADVNKYRRWMEINRYPETTVQTYTSMMIKFLGLVSPKEANECTADDLARIVEEHIIPNNLSRSYQNQMISAVKKFYSCIYRSVIDPGTLTRPRPHHRLPNVLSKDEVKKIINALTNEKHRVMLSLIYACGLRRSELLGLVPSDIERTRIC